MDWIFIKIWLTFSTRLSALPTPDQVHYLLEALPRFTYIFSEHSDFAITMIAEWQISYIKVSIGGKFLLIMKTELHGLVHLSAFGWQCYGKHFVLLLKVVP